MKISSADCKINPPAQQKNLNKVCNISSEVLPACRRSSREHGELYLQKARYSLAKIQCYTKRILPQLIRLITQNACTLLRYSVMHRAFGKKAFFIKRTGQISPLLYKFVYTFLFATFFKLKSPINEKCETIYSTACRPS